MDDLPTDLDIDTMSKNQLLHWVRKLKVQVSGNKPDLRERLKTVAKSFAKPSVTPNLQDNLADVEEKRKIFDLPEIEWSQDLSKVQVPAGFDLDVIRKFHTSLTVNDEVLAAGSEKPTIEGRRMYLRSKIQLCESAQKDSYVLFRCNIEDCMRNSFR